MLIKNFFRKLMDGLRCIDNFTQKCLEREHRHAVFLGFPFLKFSI
jgi:hypothetical protein